MPRSATPRRRTACATWRARARSGPGSTNMLTGAATATVNRIPVLLLPSDIFAHRRPGNVLQQIEHPVEADVSVNDAFRPLSRFFDRMRGRSSCSTALPRAMRVLTDPAETGAVTISLPQDVQGEAFDVPGEFFCASGCGASSPPARDAQQSQRPSSCSAREAADDYRGRRRPLFRRPSRRWRVRRGLRDTGRLKRMRAKGSRGGRARSRRARAQPARTPHPPRSAQRPTW